MITPDKINEDQGQGGGDFFTEELRDVCLKIAKIEDKTATNNSDFHKVWFTCQTPGDGFNKIVTRRYFDQKSEMVDGKMKNGDIFHFKKLIQCVGLMKDGKVDSDFRISDLVGGTVIADVERQYNNEKYFTVANLRPDTPGDTPEPTLEPPKEELPF